MSDKSNLHSAIERVILNPKYHDGLMLIKAIRNGLVYGTKIRFPHALVMVFLFRTGSFREKVSQILKATRQHARNLALFALIYKATCLVLARSRTKRTERSIDPFIAGLLGGYYVFGRSRSSVTQQIVIYIFARVALAVAKLAIQPPSSNALIASQYGGRGGIGFIHLSDEVREKIQSAAWPVFASLSWASVMWLFEWYPDMLQPSLKSSMTYIYANADHWDSLRNFVWHNR